MLFSCERLSFAVLISSVSSRELHLTEHHRTDGADDDQHHRKIHEHFDRICTVSVTAAQLFFIQLHHIVFLFLFLGRFRLRKLRCRAAVISAVEKTKSYAFDVDAILFPPFGNLSQQIQLYSLRVP